MLKIEEQYKKRYYESFIKYWIPIYKKQLFKAKLTNNTDLILEIKENIYKNINLEKYRIQIFKELNIYHI